jgi:5-formyltetrahydrofolate cyclo-ligase
MALSDEIRLLTMRLRREHTEEERHGCSLAIAQKFTAHPKFIQARTILFLISGEYETDTRPLLLAALLEKKTVALLKTDTENEGSFEARKIESTYDLDVGPSGFLEPPSGSEKIPLESIGLAVVPGEIFDISGNRIGRNGSYSKESLLLASNAHVMGIACEYQIVNDNAVGAFHDAIVDEILTEKRDIMTAQGADRRAKERADYLEEKKRKADEAEAKASEAEVQRESLESSNKVSENATGNTGGDSNASSIIAHSAEDELAALEKSNSVSASEK